MRKLAVMAVAGLMACCAGKTARAATPPPTKEGIEFFEKNIRPVLVDKCYECHSAEKKKIKGKLRVDDYASMLKGGESGKPSIVPGNPDASLLLFSMTYKDKDTADHDALLMPPPKNGKAKKLPDDVIEKFREWIKMGAPYPQGGSSRANPVGPKVHWAFVPPAEPKVPQVKQASWVKNAIDRFVLAKLEDNKLHPSNPADKRTLIRRATFDLIGLPPTEQEVSAFEADASPNAFEKVVDRLLASPRYGERWGRYWLDVARYSDTKGYVFQEERRYPYAYTYRDWVIKAFNDDMPYDRFLTLQIAADKVDLHDDKASLAAEGFLTLGRRFLNNAPDVIDDRIDVVCRGTMALTVGCARCHDHKFDPISQNDYYALYAIFNNSTEPQPQDLPLIGEPEQTPEYQRFQQELARRTNELESFEHSKLAEHAAALRAPTLMAQCLLAAQYRGTPQQINVQQELGIRPLFVDRWRAMLDRHSGRGDAIFSAWRAYADIPAGQFAARAPRVTDEIAAWARDHTINPLVAGVFASPPASLHEVAGRYAKLLAAYDTAAPRANAQEEALRKILRGPGSPVELNPEQLKVALDRKESEQDRKLRSAVEKLQATNPAAPPRAMVMQDVTPLRPQHVFLRGNPASAGDAVKPHFLTVLCGGHPTPFTDGSGRLELARAIASKSNPLTARVIVNRIWLHHFGQAIVRTPSDFGTRCDPPTHPELLDWLALRFMENGWSIKKLHKLIMLSATYQQSSIVDPIAGKADPENQLLSHFNRLRLDWESTRDALLFAAGRLDTKVGGRPVDAFTSDRRTVYAYIDRQDVPGVFRAFDFASPDATSPQRFTTTVPQQALFLMNSPFAVQDAQGLIGRREVAGASDPTHRIIRLYQILFQRPPTPAELSMGMQFLASDSDDRPSSVWQYGFGRYDDEAHRVDFTRMRFFTGKAWQGSATLPDAKLAYVTLNSGGGHPGADLRHASIRRWVSPIDGVIRITGTLSHAAAQGDGVHARIVSSRLGELASWNVFHTAAATHIDEVVVRKGDAIDFIVDCRGGDLCDSYQWAPVIDVASAPIAGNDGPAKWSAADGFAGPETKHQDAWVRYAQVLLEANEFVFID